MDKNKHYELFGSDSEDEDSEPEAPAKAPQAGKSTPSASSGFDDDDNDDDLFGEDGDEGERPGVRAGEADEGDLFGDEDEGEENEAVAPSVPSGPPLHLELPQIPRPPTDAELFFLKLPNILSFQPRPFDSAEYRPEDDTEIGGDRGPSADNVVRWRETAEGNKESNARMVRWSDGSMTLHVGSEVLAAHSTSMGEGHTHLYIRHKGSHLECHGVLRKKLGLRPVSLDSSTHRALTKKINKLHTKERRMKLTSTHEDPEAKARQDEKSWLEKNQLQARQAARQRQNEYPQLTEDFLDEPEPNEDQLEGNLGALRKQFKDKKKHGFGGGGSFHSGGKRVRRPGQRRDSDESEEEEDEEEEEEEEGATGEMDGFIVGDDDDEEEDDDEEDE